MPASAKQMLESVDRALKCHELRASGMRNVDVAAALKVDPGTIPSIMQRAERLLNPAADPSPVDAEVWVMLYGAKKRPKQQRSGLGRLGKCGKCGRLIARSGMPFPAMCRCAR